jgi:hypothetical protein
MPRSAPDEASPETGPVRQRRRIDLRGTNRSLPACRPFRWAHWLLGSRRWLTNVSPTVEIAVSVEPSARCLPSPALPHGPGPLGRRTRRGSCGRLLRPSPGWSSGTLCRRLGALPTDGEELRPQGPYAPDCRRPRRPSAVRPWTGSPATRATRRCCCAADLPEFRARVERRSGEDSWTLLETLTHPRPGGPAPPPASP